MISNEDIPAVGKAFFLKLYHDASKFENLSYFAGLNFFSNTPHFSKPTTNQTVSSLPKTVTSVTSSCQSFPDLIPTGR